MRRVLTHPNGVGAALVKPHAQKKYLAVIGETPEVSRQTRLSIYGNGYFWRIIDAVGATFSSVRNIIGADEFHDLARAYLVKHPSIYKSIDDIGGHLAGFLKTLALTKRFPFLPDLAAIEWAAHQSFFADDAPLLDMKKLKNIKPADWPTAKIKLDGSVKLLASQWPVNEIWKDDGEWSKPRLKRLKKSPQFFLIYRNASDKFVRIPKIDSIRYQLLSRLAAGHTLEQTLARLPTTAEKAGSFQSWFQEWVEDGVIRDIQIQPR